MAVLLAPCSTASSSIIPKTPILAKLPTKSSLLKPTTNLTIQTNTFFSSYSKSKPIDDTLRLFHLLPTHDTDTWNTLLSASSTQAQFTTTLHLFLQMINSSGSHQQPDTITFRWVLKSCLETKNFSFALQTHGYMVKMYGTCSSDVVTSTCLINFYNEFGYDEVARRLFDEMPERDIVAFTSMMVGYNDAGKYWEALMMFRNMLAVGNLMPNEFSFTSVLTACAGLSSVMEGEQIHAHIVKSSMESDVFVGTALTDMYAKCNRVDCAEKAFLQIDTPNVVSWNALMGGSFGGKEVIGFLSAMRNSGVIPNHLTFANVLRNCEDVRLFTVQQIFGVILKMFGRVDMFIGAALVEILTDHRCVKDAKKLFHGVHGKDITSYNLAIKGFARNGYIAEAVMLFYESLQTGVKLNEATLSSLMIEIKGSNQGKQYHALATKFGFCRCSETDGSIASSLIMMYSEFGCLDDAIRLFHQVPYPDLVLWTSIISVFTQAGECQEALKFYILMFEELAESPNDYTFSCVLSCCSRLTAIEEGTQIHSQVIKSGLSTQSDAFVTTSLIDMYSKSGYITEARRLFDKLQERDLAVWNAMITGLAQHGYADAAMKMFQELMDLPYLEPNHITYVGVLSACSHRGLLEEGYRYFKLIKDPTIEHYTCLIDLLGRAGHLDEALNLAKEMPFDPSEFIWSSLLAASSFHGNLDVAEYSAKHLLQLNPKDPGTYVALSNIYASLGKWEDVNTLRKLMKSEGVNKKPGKSWLRVNGRTHVFAAIDPGSADYR